MPRATRRSRHLTERAEAAGIEALALSPRMGDFNEDLQAFGPGALRAALRIQLAPQDAVRFMRQERPGRGDRWRFEPSRPIQRGLQGFQKGHEILVLLP